MKVERKQGVTLVARGAREARDMLAATDYIALRVGGEPNLPEDWQAARNAWRVIVKTGAGPWIDMPATKPWDR